MPPTPDGVFGIQTVARAAFAGAELVFFVNGDGVACRLGDGGKVGNAQTAQGVEFGQYGIGTLLAAGTGRRMYGQQFFPAVQVIVFRRRKRGFFDPFRMIGGIVKHTRFGFNFRRAADSVVADGRAQGGK